MKKARCRKVGDSNALLRPEGRAPVILVADAKPERLRIICQTIAECGAQADLAGDPATLPHRMARAGCFVALVALGGTSSPGALGLACVQGFKQNGFKIVAYEDGAQSWPIGQRCLGLLAGASEVLDSASLGFAANVRDFLARALGALAIAQVEQQKIVDITRELGMVGVSPAMLSIFRTVLRVSKLSDLPALITGETGTGKELVARAIHRLDPKRRDGPFVAANCAAINLSLAESEFFGHRRGAFTGAERDRKGLIRAAQGGVLFLDEIGELDPAIQPKLLRVLQESRVLGLGEDQEAEVNARVLAATNRDLARMTAEGEFREDLFHRLDVFSIHIPPLRERPDDLEPLVLHFLRKHGALSPGEVPALEGDFVEALGQLALPGNARQVENLVRQALVRKEAGRALSLGYLPQEVWRELSDRRSRPTASPEPRPGASLSQLAELLEANDGSLTRCLDSCEKLLLEATLRRSNGNQSQTARRLGLTSRSIYNKLRKHRLHV